LTQVGREHRLHLLLHAGSPLEILQRFELYGLGNDHVAVVFGSYCDNRAIALAWLDKQQLIDEAESARE